MKCRKCKREIQENSVFCNWCGSRQVKDADSVSVPKAKKLPSGSWMVQFMFKGVRYNIVKDSAKEAESAALDQKKRLIESGKNPSSMTLGEAIDRFITERENLLSPSTLRSYKSYRAFRFQSLMETKISAISESVLQSAINKELEQVAPKTVKNALGMLTTASEKVTGVKLSSTKPKTKKSSHAFLEPEEIPIFLEHMRGTRFEAAVLLGMHSLRLSEILALEQSDIDIRKSIIHVNKAVIYDGKKLVERDLNKTYKSTRDIPILIPRLAELTHQIPIEVSSSTLYRNIKRVCKEMGIKNIGIHGLRHTFASLAASDAVNMPQLECMRLGGWSSPAVLTEIYTHVASADRKRSQESMKNFFKQISNGLSEVQ